jgi:hypothetical protein
VSIDRDLSNLGVAIFGVTSRAKTCRRVPDTREKIGGKPPDARPRDRRWIAQTLCQGISPCVRENSEHDIKVENRGAFKVKRKTLEIGPLKAGSNARYDLEVGTGSGNWKWELEVGTGSGNWKWEQFPVPSFIVHRDPPDQITRLKNTSFRSARSVSSER